MSEVETGVTPRSDEDIGELDGAPRPSAHWPWLLAFLVVATLIALLLAV